MSITSVSNLAAAEQEELEVARRAWEAYTRAALPNLRPEGFQYLWDNAEPADRQRWVTVVRTVRG